MLISLLFFRYQGNSQEATVVMLDSLSKEDTLFSIYASLYLLILLSSCLYIYIYLYLHKLLYSTYKYYHYLFILIIPIGLLKNKILVHLTVVNVGPMIETSLKQCIL